MQPALQTPALLQGMAKQGTEPAGSAPREAAPWIHVASFHGMDAVLKLQPFNDCNKPRPGLQSRVWAVPVQPPHKLAGKLLLSCRLL